MIYIQFSILLSFVNPKIDDAFDLFFVLTSTYTKKVGASPGTVVAVVLGLIGGVTTSVTFFCIFVYSMFRTIILKKWSKEQSLT